MAVYHGTSNGQDFLHPSQFKKGKHRNTFIEMKPNTARASGEDPEVNESSMPHYAPNLELPKGAK